MASASSRAPKRARVDRTTQIINQAAELFRERGYARTSLKAVAERLNLTEPALYYYFPSKERLLYQIVYETLDHANAELKEIAADTELTPPQKMDRVVHVIVNTAVDRLDMFTEMRTSALLQKALHGPEVLPAARALRGNGFHLRVLIEKPARLLAEDVRQHLQHVGRRHALSRLHHAEVGDRRRPRRVDLHAARGKLVQSEAIALAQRPQLGAEKMPLSDQAHDDVKFTLSNF